MDWLPLGKWWHPRIRTPSQWHEKSCRNLVCPPQARCTPWKYWSRCLFHSFCSCWCRFWSSWSTSCRLSMEHAICSKTTCNKHLCLWQSVWWTPPNQSKLLLLWGTFHNSALHWKCRVVCVEEHHQQLDGCSMTRPFLSAKGVACETTPGSPPESLDFFCF